MFKRSVARMVSLGVAAALALGALGGGAAGSAAAAPGPVFQPEEPNVPPLPPDEPTPKPTFDLHPCTFSPCDDGKGEIKKVYLNPCLINPCDPNVRRHSL